MRGSNITSFSTERYLPNTKPSQQCLLKEGLNAEEEEDSQHQYFTIAFEERSVFEDELPAPFQGDTARSAQQSNIRPVNVSLIEGAINRSVKSSLKTFMEDKSFGSQFGKNMGSVSQQKLRPGAVNLETAVANFEPSLSQDLPRGVRLYHPKIATNAELERVKSLQSREEKVASDSLLFPTRNTSLVLQQKILEIQSHLQKLQKSQEQQSLEKSKIEELYQEEVQGQTKETIPAPLVSLKTEFNPKHCVIKVKDRYAHIASHYSYTRSNKKQCKEKEYMKPSNPTSLPVRSTVQPVTSPSDDEILSRVLKTNTMKSSRTEVQVPWYKDKKVSLERARELRRLGIDSKAFFLARLASGSIGFQYQTNRWHLLGQNDSE